MPVLQDGALVLYGYVGDTFFDEGFTSRDVLDALAEVGRDTDVTVRINSAGGDAFEGIAIFNALSAHVGKVRVEVDAIAASAASVIAMAGDTIAMRAGSLLMIHDASGFVAGDADALKKASETVDKLSGQMASIYAARSESDVGEVRQAMKATTWMTGEEAVAKGYADEQGDEKAVAATAFDYRRFDRAPERLVALAKKNNWSFSASSKAAASAAKPRPVEERPAMTDNSETVQDTETPPVSASAGSVETPQETPKQDANERMSAILASDKIKGREKAAMDLALRSPDMTAEAVIEFVAANVPGTAIDDADAYLSRKHKANGTPGLGGAGDTPAQESKGNWSAALKRAGVHRKN